jgi:hypothetical protein
MSIKPILFNTEMVRAILDGRKSCTRRLVKPQPDEKHTYPLGFVTDSTEKKEVGCFGFGIDEYGGSIQYAKPPYQPGDILYVRETWRVGAWDIFNQMIAFDYKDGTCGELTYIHDQELFERLVNQSREDARKAKCEYNGVDFVWEKGKSPCRWHPSIHMPKEAARIWLKVTGVRVERLQEITEDQTEEEGFLFTPPCLHMTGENYCDIDGPCTSEIKYCDMGAGELFGKVLWNSTIKKSDIDRYGWDASPWAWVIEFEQCEKPEEN